MDERHRTVLSVCSDRELARFRHDVLAGVGFQVVSVHTVSSHTVSSALYEISFGRCGVLLLCHRLNKPSRETLASYFHEHCPEPYIVSILANEDDHYPPQTHARVVHSNDPAPLVRALRENLAA